MNTPTVKDETTPDAVPKCPSCEKPGKADHACPFRMELDDDHVTLCNCCDECEHECFMDT